MIRRNRNVYGARGNFLFGIAVLLDGLVRVLTLGFCHQEHRFTPMNVSAYLTKKHFEKLKQRKH